FFTDSAPTEIFTLSLHDALPICARPSLRHQHLRCDDNVNRGQLQFTHPLILGTIVLFFESERGLQHIFSGIDAPTLPRWPFPVGDRKSTRLNSSHVAISYAVFCL